MPIRNTLLVFIIPFALLISCASEEDETQSDELTRPVCTGFGLRDVTNQYLGSIGVPNNKLTTEKDFQYVLRVFPIPAAQVIQMAFDKEGGKKAWISAADISNDLAEEPILSGMLNANPGIEPLLYGSTSEDGMTFDISALPSGTYRLYVRYNNELFWENIIINRDNK